MLQVTTVLKPNEIFCQKSIQTSACGDGSMSLHEAQLPLKVQIQIFALHQNGK
jgi:hypothetical protein